MENIVAAGEEGSEKENVLLELEEPMKKKRRKSLSLRKRRFGQSVQGEHKLARMVKEIFCKIGVTGKTNNSSRATGASTLFEANVPEKLIQDKLGIDH